MNNVPDGWKLVPICPTREMRAAAGREESKYVAARATFFAGDSWVAMVEAAPEYVTEVWLGEDQPPVGVPVEYQRRGAPNGKWYPTKINFLSGQHVIFCDSDGDEIRENPSDILFRPARTPEQIAADLREKSAEELYLAINWNDTPLTWANLSQSRRADYFKAIDAGWNKFEIIDEPKS